MKNILNEPNEDQTSVTSVLESSLTSSKELSEHTNTRLGESEMLTIYADQPSWSPASLKDRFGAFVTDTLLVSLLIGAWALILQHFNLVNLTLKPFNLHQDGWILFGSTSLGLYLLYYFFFEIVFSTTPGKALSGMAIHNYQGRSPALTSMIVRNLFRLVDGALFPLAIIGCMEASRNRQRLGDVLSRTLVQRKIVFHNARINPDQAVIAGITRRSLAGLLDLSVTLIFAWGLILSIPVNHPRVAVILLNLTPFFVLLSLTIPELFFQTTLGKWVFGMRVAEEDGRPPKLPTLIVRNLFLIVDTNPVGYLCAVLSSRKQRPGDTAAGTLVLKQKRHLRSGMAALVMTVLSLILLYPGWNNSPSFLRQKTEIQWMGQSIQPIPVALRRMILKGLHIDRVSFFHEKQRSISVFHPGNIVSMELQVYGYRTEQNQAWLQADVLIRDSQKNVILNRPNMLNASLSVGNKPSAALLTQFALHPQALPGRYEVSLILRDGFARTQTQEVSSFVVEP